MSKSKRACELARVWWKGEEARLELCELLKDQDHPVRALDLELEQVPGAVEIAEQQRALQEQSLGTFQQGQAGGLGQLQNDWVQQAQSQAGMLGLQQGQCGAAHLVNTFDPKPKAKVSRTKPRPYLTPPRVAILALLAPGQPMHVKHIQAQLPDMNPKTVAATCSYLSKHGELVRVHNGVYQRV